MSKIKVSIIIPVYNTEKYLKSCLDSVINQTLKDIEIICIDDGSTDNSLKILNEYANKDNRIKIISKENGGQAIARNIGIKNANGEYIGFVDSDDYVDLKMFEKLYSHAKSNNLDMNMCKVSLFEDGTTNFQNNVWYYALNVFGNFKKDIFSHKDTQEFTCEISVTPYNKLYKRSFINEHDIKFAENLIFEDEVFFFDAYLRAKRVSLLKENLYFYRTERAGSTVEKGSDKDYSDIVEIFKMLREIFIETKNYEDYKILLCNRFIHLELWRYSQTAKKYRENFYNNMKEDLIELLEDIEIKNNLSSNIKSRVNKMIQSSNFEDFEEKDKYKEFSIIMACYNTEKYVEEAILSIINQNFDFESNVQLILVDDGSADKTGEICKKYANEYPENILYIYQNNSGQASARNLGLKYATGKYINFLDSDDKLKNDTLTSVYDFFEENYDKIDFVSIKITFFEKQNGRHALNYKYDKNLIVSLEDYWDYPQLSAASAFFKKEVFDDFEFDTTLISSEDAIMINKLLINKMAYGVITGGEYYYRKRMDETSTIDTSKFDKNFYNNRLDHYFLEMINYSIEKCGWVPKFIQYTIIYDLQWLIQNSNIDAILNKNEIEEVYSKIKLVLSYIEDEVILKLKTNNENTKKHLLAFKYDNPKIEIIKNNVTMFYENYKIDVLNWHKIYLDILEIRSENLYISGYLVSFFEKKDIEIIAERNSNGEKEKYTGKYVFYEKRDERLLNKNIETCYNFDIIIPLDNNENSNIKIFVKYDSHMIRLPIVLENHTNLSLISNYSINKNHFLELDNNDINITNYSYVKHIKKELKILKKIWNGKDAYYTSALFTRLTYLLLFLFYKNKTIWLFMDRQEKADDNAEHLFRYAIKQKDPIKKYFIINKDSKDYDRLKKIGNTIGFYTIKHRLLYLFADKIISSHPDDIILNPFMGKNVKLYSGLFSYTKHFLQHGVTKDDISQWLHKYDKNLKTIVTVSEMEYKSFLKYNYNYDEEVIKLLGFSRFDNLFNNSKLKTKKQVLIAPSWRENLSKSNEMQIKNSEYFIKINSLINNSKLIDIAKKYGYEIIFKPHPLTYKFIDLFDENEYVSIDYDTNYQDLLINSSIMITDYSSVSYDFAYLKKPILYYQYGNDYNFDKTFFSYENDGFGEVCDNESDLINNIEYYLENNCKMKNIYKDRVNKYFKYIDNKNSERIYDKLYEN